MKARIPHRETPRKSVEREIADEMVKKSAGREIYRQIIEREKHFQTETDAMYLWAAHVFLRVGVDRLRRFYKFLSAQHEELIRRYSLEPEDEGWIYPVKLKEIGFDIEKELHEIEKDKQEGTDD